MQMCQTVVEKWLVRFRNELMKNSYWANTFFAWNSSQGCLKDSSLSWNLLKQNVHYLFYYFQSGRGWNGSMQMDAGGNSFVQRQYDVIKSQSSALAAARLSRPRLLLFASNLFLSPRLVSLILSAECRVPPSLPAPSWRLWMTGVDRSLGFISSELGPSQTLLHTSQLILVDLRLTDSIQLSR